MPKINKNIILIVALVVVAVVGYFIFTGGDDTAEAPLVGVQAGAASTGMAQEIVIELNRLRALQSINGDFFANPAFVSLRDFTQTVVPQPIGRNNPFAPIGQ